MSMSEFERLMNEWEEHPSHVPALEQELPADFSDEELAFAQELDSLFDLAKEDVPPYFVQTLMQAEEERFDPVESGFELKTSARVFKRLKLRRQLFPSQRPSFRSLVQSFPLHRPALALIAACLLVMVFTMGMTSTSFAAGWNILWSGAHSGVIQVTHYPGSGVASTKSSAPSKKTHTTAPPVTQISLVDAQQQLQFPIYWPTSMPDSYNLNAIYLHNGVGQNWANGPILELNYSYTAHGPTVGTHGSEHIVICEFKPLGDVFQVVQLGAARLIQIDNKGNATAIYVDGQWKRIDRFSHAWVYGERSELIYERDGVIFWIAGDQRDGVNSTALGQIAESLQVMNVKHIAMMSEHMRAVLEPTNDSSWVFADDVVYFDNLDGPLGKTVTTVGTVGTVGTDQPTLKGGMHSH